MRRLLALLICTGLVAPAANVLTVTKTPYEQFMLSVNFSQVIGTDGMSLSQVIAVNRDTGVNTTSTIIASSPAPAISTAGTIAFRVQGGNNGQTHIIGVRVVDTTTGDEYEGQVTLVVNSGTGH